MVVQSTIRIVLTAGGAVAREEEESGDDGDRVGVLRRLLAAVVRRHDATHIWRQHRRR